MYKKPSNWNIALFMNAPTQLNMLTEIESLLQYSRFNKYLRRLMDPLSMPKIYGDIFLCYFT